MPRKDSHTAGSSADWIEAQAAAHEARALRRVGGEILAQVDLRRADGKIVPYRLLIDARNPRVSVREERPERLPGFCPDRHINPDGSFCMNWDEEDPVHVTDMLSAEHWWDLLLAYLWRQERASKTGRWAGRAWAHGVAAEQQRLAQRCATALGSEFTKALEAGRLSVSRSKGGSGRFLQLRNNGQRVYSVWEKEKRVATLRRRCVCGGSKLPLVGCRDHARQAADLALALLRWEEAERRFWQGMKDEPCCGTMKTCPLAANSSADSALRAHSSSAHAA